MSPRRVPRTKQLLAAFHHTPTSSIDPALIFSDPTFNHYWKGLMWLIHCFFVKWVYNFRSHSYHHLRKDKVFQKKYSPHYFHIIVILSMTSALAGGFHGRLEIFLKCRKSCDNIAPQSLDLFGSKYSTIGNTSCIFWNGNMNPFVCAAMLIWY